MKKKVQIHDGIVGALILLGVVLNWMWLPGLVGVLMIVSAFTGFCPVYFLLNKFMPAGEDGGKCC